MTLRIHVKSARNLRGKGRRQVKIVFRGTTKKTEIVPTHNKEAVWDEEFEWGMGSKMHPHETIDFTVYTHGKIRGNVILGGIVIMGQGLAEFGELYIDDPLLKSGENAAMEPIITMYLAYFAPDGKIGTFWMRERFKPEIVEEEDWWDDGRSSIYSDVGHRRRRKKKKGMEDFSDSDDDSDDEKLVMSAMYGKRPMLEDPTMIPRDWQVNVTVIEAKQLAGVDISPVIVVGVGDDTKYTAQKHSTNNPYYNEMFVFDYHCSQATLFDKVIKIRACESYNPIVSGKIIGQFKFDIGTLHLTPGHSFFHKWAVLFDPKDINGGIKGYIKMNISYFGKGEIMKNRVNVDDEDNIEKEENLLLPEGIKVERPMAEYRVKLYKAEGLPIMNSVMLANVKKVFTGSIKDLVDPFVTVHFGGQKARTSVKKKKYDPVWNQQIVFKENFPPLCRRMRIELRDRDGVIDELIGTHFIDLTEIENDGNKGFLPTFGPSWIYFYGSCRGYSTLRDHSQLNKGLGEGCMYRGRLLMAVEAKVKDKKKTSGSISVDVSGTNPISESAAGREEEFLLFGCLMDAGMINRKHGDKHISFELTIGNDGNILDGNGGNLNTMEELFNISGMIEAEAEAAKRKKENKTMTTEEKEAEEEARKTKPSRYPSMTHPMRPEIRDKYFCYMPYEENKPCTYVKFSHENLLRRLCDRNIMSRIAERLEEGLTKVNDRIVKSIPKPDSKLRRVMKQLNNDCLDVANLKKESKKHYSGKTKLDKERHTLILREMEKIAKDSSGLRVTAENVKDKLKEAYGMLRKIQHLTREPQGSLPDVFIWMICGEKRVAYYRIPVRTLFYSTVEEERGTRCGQLQTVFLRLPGKKSVGKSGWATQCKLEIYLWLGRLRDKKESIKGLPTGYNMTAPVKSIGNSEAAPPRIITYRCKQIFQLRAHMYQARGIIASDDSGLSDPFVKVIIGNQYRCTQVIEETLCAIWDETLIFDEVVLYGDSDDLQKRPPMVVMELYDQDKVGEPDFIGRALGNPLIKPASVPYMKPKFPPKLEWFGVYRGRGKGGEILAAFELMGIDESLFVQRFPKLPMGIFAGERPNIKKSNKTMIIPIPQNIRPVVCLYRIEILFWGVRRMKRLQLLTVDCPRVDIEIAGTLISSTVIDNADKNPNFNSPLQILELELPEDEIYCPPINIRVVDCRRFGRIALAGTHVIPTMRRFKFDPIQAVKRPAPPSLLEITGPDEGGSQGDADNMQVPNGSVVQDSNGSREEVNDLAVDDKMDTISIASGRSGKSVKSARNSIVSGISGKSLKSTRSKTGSQLRLSRASLNGSQILHPPIHTEGPPINAILEEQSNGQENGGDVVINMPPGDDQPQKKDSITIDMKATETTQMGSQTTTAPQGNKVLTANGLPPKQGDLAHRTVKGPQKPAGNQTNKGPATKGQPGQVAGEEIEPVEEVDENTLDWWSKYFETLAEMEREAVQKNDNEEEEDENDLLSIDADGEADSVNKEGPKVNNKEKGKSKSTDKAVVSKSNAASSAPKAIQPKRNIATFKIYQTELEQVPEFKGFREWLHTFDLTRGKNTSDEDEGDDRVVGILKGSFSIYKLPLPDRIEGYNPFGFDPTMGYFHGLPNNEPMGVCVRVYVVRGIDLHPTDLTGKTDPYLRVQLGNQKVSERDQYISKQLNPTFGRSFEFEVTFPQESLLTVKVYDWDFIGVDDFIGETSIDLENRYYSRHRPLCGISQEYATQGYNSWRDGMKPTQILSKLCRSLQMDEPEYEEGQGTVMVGNKVFHAKAKIKDDGRMVVSNEPVALEALKRWNEVKGGFHLVPEHVETRSLFNPRRPGIEQGKIQMWVDMFPMDIGRPPVPVDITPRKPKKYELRVIVWNTADVILEDTSLITGDKMSDIYVKGWLVGDQGDVQETDVHYSSLTGEGMFNWRFVFPFEYLDSEEKIVFKKKEYDFSIDETEYKIPPRLNLQVWDNDTFSADDILGTLILDLNRFPRGAKDSKKCKLNMMDRDSPVPMLSLFKLKKTRGWWPFARKTDEDDEPQLTGKLEAEMTLLTGEEADKSPAGMGRKEPEALDKPNRPNSSFLNFMGPLKALKYLICVRLKWIIIKALILALLLCLLGLFFYSMPGYTIKKMFGA